MVNDTPLRFYPLTFVKDEDGITVGRSGLDSYAVFPPEGIALLQRMQSGIAPDIAAKWYEDQYGEPVDIEDFLATLRELRFIQDHDKIDENRSHSSTPFLQYIGNIAFSPFAWALYVFLFCFCIYDIVRIPQLLPVYKNIFFSPYITIVEIGLFLGQFPGIFFHEFYHMLAASRLGLSSRLSVGHRLYFVVFETDLTDLWGVPRSSRYLPYLAGMVADIIWFSLLTIIAGATITSIKNFSFIGAFCAALAFSTLMRFLWQFYFHLRTDLYYVFSNAFKCINLHNITQRYIRNCLLRLLRSTHKIEDESLWPTRDLQVSRWYAPFWIVGYLFTIATFLLGLLPVILRVLYQMVSDLFTNHYVSTSSFWDSLIFLSLNSFQLAIIAIVFFRDRRNRRLPTVTKDGAL